MLMRKYHSSRTKFHFTKKIMNTKLTTQEYIDFLQRYIILHSYIYYELNGNVISNRQYDEKAKELVKYKNEYPDLWKTSMYYKQFSDEYNGATGFTLFHDLSEHQKEIIRSLVPKNLR